MKKFISILLFFLAFTEGFGQSLADTVQLKEVFVTSVRQLSEKALNVKSIDSLVLATSVSSDLSDLLHRHSSLYIKSYGAGGLATASFRGTSASHTEVLWNGLKINSPLWGQTDLSLMPVFFTDEVSLYYGSSSLVKTSGGLGGCISLNNTPEWNKGANVSLTQTAGSFGYLLSQIGVGYSSKKIVTNTRFILDKANNNFSYYDNVSGSFGDKTQQNADYSKQGFLQEFYYKAGKRQFAGIKVMGVWNDRNLPPIMGSESASRYENQKDALLNITGEWKYYGTGSNWSFNTGAVHNRLDYILTFTNPEGEKLINYNTEAISTVFSNKLNFQHNFSEKTSLKSFADAYFTKASYNDRKDGAGFDVDRTDFTVQSSVHHAFTSLFSGYALAQQKILDGEWMPFIAAAGLEYTYSNSRELVFRTNMGRNLQIPTLNDKYFTPGGNPNLLPEVGYQFDAGFQWVNTFHEISYQVEITGFSAWIENWILWRPSEFRYWVASNVLKVFSRGAEVNTSFKGKAGKIKYQLKGGYAYTRTTDEGKESDSRGNQLIYIPRHVINVNLFAERGLYSTFVSFHNTGSRYASTVESVAHQVSPYHLLDFGAGKNFKLKRHSLDLNFKLNNVLDKNYQAIKYRAMPGRNFSVSLTLNILSRAMAHNNF